MNTSVVLHVRSSAGLYGAEHVLLGLILALARLDVSSRLLCLDNHLLGHQPLHDRALALGLDSRLIPCQARLDWRTIRALRSEMLAAPRGIIHVHDYKSAFYAWIARGTRRHPIVATVHGQFSETAALKLYHRIELALLRRFDRVCVVSEAMKPMLAAAGVDPDAVVLVENGIDTERFRPDVEPLDRHKLGILAEAFVFGAAMRLGDPKFPLGLIDAFATAFGDTRDAIRPAALLIAGDGPQRAAVELRIRERGIAHCVRLLGARNDLEHFYPCLDAFVLPSLSEGLPLALLEAMASSVPVIATTVGQVPEVLRDLGASLVAPGDVSRLGQAMSHALATSPTSSGLRSRVEQRYSVDRMARDYAAVYAAVCDALDSGRVRPHVEN